MERKLAVPNFTVYKLMFSIDDERKKEMERKNPNY